MPSKSYESSRNALREIIALGIIGNVDLGSAFFFTQRYGNDPSKKLFRMCTIVANKVVAVELSTDQELPIEMGSNINKIDVSSDYKWMVVLDEKQSFKLFDLKSQKMEQDMSVNSAFTAVEDFKFSGNA